MDSACLTTDQARYIYKTVGNYNLVNEKMIEQEIEDKKDNELREEIHIRI